MRNMGVVEGQPILSSNQWEDVKMGGETAIRSWIDQQLKDKACVVVLVGAQTAGRKWVNYEIKEGWNSGKGVLGVHVHRLKDAAGAQDYEGANPFTGFTVGAGKNLSGVVKLYDPPYSNSQDVYDYIKTNLANWVEEAIQIRKNFRG